MSELPFLEDANQFAESLYAAMIQVNPGIAELALYEFRYALDNITPANGWASVPLLAREALEAQISQPEFFNNIQLKPVNNKHIVLDESIVQLTQTLLVGLVKAVYPVAWVNRLFYFDIRSFIFYVRTRYYIPEILTRFGGGPYLQVELAQKRFDASLEIGYQEFKAANQVLDQAFIRLIQCLINTRGAPLLLTLVGPSAAGKTEIIEQLRSSLAASGRSITVIEMDHFFKDREFRDGRPVDKNVIHFDLFQHSLAQILRGQTTMIPRYDFAQTSSSHDENSLLKPGKTMLQIQPAEIILLEGNFPFHIPEISPLAGIKIVYLTDDPIRLKRKWKRDIDYRKKYNPVYFCNRYFRTQFLRVQEIYLPMMQICDLIVDTTSASIWAAPAIMAELGPASQFDFSLEEG